MRGRAISAQFLKQPLIHASRPFSRKRRRDKSCDPVARKGGALDQAADSVELFRFSLSSATHPRCSSTPARPKIASSPRRYLPELKTLLRELE